MLGNRRAAAGLHLDAGLLRAVGIVGRVTQCKPDVLGVLLHPPQVSERALHALGLLDLLQPVHDDLLESFELILCCDDAVACEQPLELRRRGYLVDPERRALDPGGVLHGQLRSVPPLVDGLQEIQRQHAEPVDAGLPAGVAGVGVLHLLLRGERLRVRPEPRRHGHRRSHDQGKNKLNWRWLSSHVIL